MQKVLIPHQTKAVPFFLFATPVVKKIDFLIEGVVLDWSGEQGGGGSQITKIELMLFMDSPL